MPCAMMEETKIALRLAAEATVDIRTAKKWLSGLSVTSPYDEALVAAAKRLGIHARRKKREEVEQEDKREQ